MPQHSSAAPPADRLHPELSRFLKRSSEQLEQITPSRRAELDQLASTLAEVGRGEEPIRAVFICTHNSRRSHLAQLWSAAAAQWLGLETFHSFSGGTEVTAFNDRCFPSLERAGFRITHAAASVEDSSGGAQPHSSTNPQWIDRKSVV